MDFSDRLNLLPDNVRRKILDSICGIPAVAGPVNADNASNSVPTAPVQYSSGRVVGNDSTKRTHLSPALPDVKLAAGACIVDNFIEDYATHAALACAKEALAEQQRPAAIGGGLPTAEGRAVEQQSRGDIMRWLSLEEEQAAGRGALAAVMRRMECVRRQLEAQGYDVGGRPTYQLACYPGGGARYVRHADASVSCPSRTVTAIVYLTAEWDVQAHGGSLALYNVPYSGPLYGRGVEAGEPATLVAPLGGRLVVFEGHLFHEVLPAHSHRYALTAWFHRKPPPGQPVPAPAPEAPGKEVQQDQYQQQQQGDQQHRGKLEGQEAAMGAPPAAQHTVEEHADDGADATNSIAGRMAASAGAAHAPQTTTVPGGAGEPVGGVSGGADGAQGAGAAPAQAPGPHAAAPRIAGLSTTSDRILVCIAAYRDPECQWTMHSLLSSAAHPERVRIAVVWQVDPVADSGFVRVAGAGSHPAWLAQVRHVTLPQHEATGPCKARALCQALWDGEEYVLQLDSHMRMVPGWDDVCVQQLREAEALSSTGRAVLSCYPLGYHGDGAAASAPDPSTAPATLLCAGGFGPDGFLRTVGRCLRQRPAAPVPSLFWAAGLSFARSSWMQEVPYCPHLPHLFFGEELHVLARAWTRGWDVFAPAVPLAFHQWERAARLHTYQRDHHHGANGVAVGAVGSVKPVGADGAGETPGMAVGGASGAAAGVGEAKVEEEVVVEDAGVGAAGGGAGGGEGGVAAEAEVEASVGAQREASRARVLGVLGVTGCTGSGGGGTAPGGAGVRVGAGRGGGGSVEEDWAVGGVWGLGTVRSLQQLQEHLGVDFAAREVLPRAVWGGQRLEAFLDSS